MTTEPIFRLFACCIPVCGACRSTICDLQRKTYHLIPNALYEILTEHRGKTVAKVKELYGAEHDATIDEYFDFLITNDLGFWADEPDAFPDLDLTWDRPEVILNAIVDVDEASEHDWERICQQLDELGCKALQIRFFCEWSPERVDREVLRFCARGRIRGIELILQYGLAYTEEALEDLCMRHQRIIAVFLHSSPETHSVQLEKSGTWICYRVDQLDSHAHCGQIHPAYFSPTLDCFLEAQAHNTCLNRKIAIDVRGEIKNCPALPRSFGNVRDTSLHGAVAKQGFRDLWEINKDQIEVCKDCEFRYICTDCRAFIHDPLDLYSKPSKCGYDPYTAQWS